MDSDTSTSANNVSTATTARKIHLVHLSSVILEAFVMRRRRWGHCCCDFGFVTLWLVCLGPISASTITGVDQPQTHIIILSIRTLFVAKEISCDLNLASFLLLAKLRDHFELFLICVRSSTAVQNLHQIDKRMICRRSLGTLCV